jgi:hypothetical protein
LVPRADEAAGFVNRIAPEEGTGTMSPPAYSWGLVVKISSSSLEGGGRRRGPVGSGGTVRTTRFPSVGSVEKPPSMIKHTTMAMAPSITRGGDMGERGGGVSIIIFSHRSRERRRDACSGAINERGIKNIGLKHLSGRRTRSSRCSRTTNNTQTVANYSRKKKASGK